MGILLAYCALVRGHEYIRRTGAHHGHNISTSAYTGGLGESSSNKLRFIHFEYLHLIPIKFKEKINKI